MPSKPRSATSSSARTLLGDLTQTFAPIESWGFDRIVADAVRAMSTSIVTAIAEIAAAGGRVLDVGSGGGQLGCDLAQRFPEVRFVGIDSSPEQVRRAVSRASSFGDRVQFRTAFAEDLPFEDNSFDAVVSGGSIKHWPNRAAGFAEMVRVARPGGVVVLGELDRGCSLDDARAFVSTWRIPRIARGAALLTFRTYTAGQSLDIDDFRDLARDPALEQVTIERVPGFPSIELTARKS